MLQQTTLAANAVLGDALNIISKGTRVTCFQVISSEGSLIGLLTETDIVRAAVDTAVDDVAVEPILKYVRPLDVLVWISNEQFATTSKADISTLMAHKRIKHLPVLDASLRPQGVIDSILASSGLLSSLLAVCASTMLKSQAHNSHCDEDA